MPSPRVHALAFPIELDAGLGVLMVERDHRRYVDQLVRQVLLTSQGERVNRPDFGAGLRELLFAVNDPTTATLLKTAVLEALTTWLSSVLTVERVDVAAEDSTVVVTVAYRVKGVAGSTRTEVELS